MKKLYKNKTQYDVFFEYCTVKIIGAKNDLSAKQTIKIRKNFKN